MSPRPRTKVEHDALRSLKKLMHFGEAQIAVARKLTMNLYRMWVGGTEFRFGREPGASLALGQV